METAEDNISQCSDESLVLIRINIPDLGVQKCMQFHREELVWDVKQQVLAALPKEMKESFNYGLYCPPSNGKAGKFLDEERPLMDYPFPGPIGYLELKYKRRVYKLMNVDEKQIKQLHTKANLRRLLDFVQGGQAEKIGKLCAKGLDPNFHCHETGETPLSLAAVQKKCNRTILALANGGALLDFRTRDGTTALHRAVEKNNLEGIKTLLDLGASPNYKDNKGLTALYSSVLNSADAHICELLLHDHAAIGAADLQGWQEVHQACRNGLVQHLEHLLFYGADMNARNASGNTPLHVCAVNEQESCARVLLFRGADKEALNFANQTPYQVAVIAGNLGLAEVINNHMPEDVVPFREPPKYNPRRRASIASSAALNRTHSDPRLEITLGIKPPSPSPSNRSLPPFSSASSLSETSTGSSSTCTQPSNDDSEDTASVSVITEKSITSESSGMCGSITCTAGGYDNYPERPAPLEGPLAPGLMCVCLENYSSDVPGHLQLSQGDIIEVTGSVDYGLLEGILRHQQGLFPASCVQEVRLRHPESRYPARRVEGRRETSIKQQQMNSASVDTSKRIGEPRTVVLHKGKKGFGFVLRGAKATSPLMEMMPSENCPALQYLDDVDKGGIADLAGLKKGDFLLTINGEDVSQASHEHVVNLIRKSGELVSMAVVTMQRAAGTFIERPQTITGRQCATLPRKLMRGKAAPAPPRRDPRTTLSVGRARARSMVAGLAEIEALDRTLMEYDSEGRSTKSSSIESLPNKQQLHSSDSLPHNKAAPIRPHSATKRMTTAKLQEIFIHQRDLCSLSKNNAHILHSPKVYGSVAEMKRSRANKLRPEEVAGAKLHKVFHSTPDLNETDVEAKPDVRPGNKEARRSHSQEDMAVVQLNGHNIQLTWERPSSRIDDDSKPQQVRDGMENEDNGPWQSIEEIYNRIPLECDSSDLKKRTLKEVVPGHPPPPTHPPPPPPVGQVVRVDVSRTRGEYAKVSVAPEVTKPSVMSSFRPGDSAKLYASPQEIGIVGYHVQPRPQAPQVSHRPVSCASIRSRSLPPNVPPPPKTSSPSSSASSETETSGDSAGYTCSTFKKSYQQHATAVAPDAVSTDSGNSSERASQVSAAVGNSTSPYAQPVVAGQFQQQIGRYPPTVVAGGHVPQEPYIPEPDYDLSDEETPTVETRVQSPPEPPRHPPPPPPVHQLPQMVTASTQRQNAIQERVQDNSTFRPAQGERKKPPPTPPSKRRDKGNNGTTINGVPLPKRDATGLADQAAVPNSCSPIGSPATVCRESTPPATKEKPKKNGHINVTMSLPTENAKTCKSESGSVNKELPPVAGKPPAVGAKSSKAASPTVLSTSPLVLHSEMAEIADFKQIIARKAAERQRRASYTTDPEVASPAGESPKHEFIEIVQHASPIEPQKEIVAAPSPPSPRRSPPLETVSVVPHSAEEDIAINVKETISVFEKKSESVKSTSPSVVRSVLKKPEEPRKVLKGSHSQIFEAKASVNNMKPSKSCPYDLAQEDSEGVAKGSRPTARIELPNETPSNGKDEGKREEESDDSDDMNDGAMSLKAKITETDPVLREDLEISIASRRILTKNVVSLSKFPPPIETGETDAESDITEPTSPREGRRGTTANSFDSSFNGSTPSSPEVAAAGNPLRRQAPVAESTSLQSAGAMAEGRTSAQKGTKNAAGGETSSTAVEEKIQHSMNLIKLHANSLQEVNTLAGLVVPPPPGFDERNAVEDLSMIAPPPEFSDDIHVPIKALEDRAIAPILDLDLEEADVAAKSAAAALAAAAGGLHLSCPSFVERNASKLPTRSSPATSVGPSLQKSHHYHPPTTMKSARQMVRPSNNNNAKVRLLPPGHPGSGSGACNGVSAEAAHCYDQGQSLPSATKLKMQPPPAHKEFRTKVMNQWTTRDVSDWLESLFLPEYKARFEAAGVDGRRLSYLDTNLLSELGVKRVGHRMNMERSLRRHSMMKQ